MPRWLKLSAAIAGIAFAILAALTFYVGRGAMVNVQADRGGIAVGGNATGVTITTGGSTNSDNASRPK